MLDINWPERVLGLEGCHQIVAANQQMTFAGPRIKMAFYEGAPTRVIPHPTSGRAKYLGPIMNR